MAVRLTSIVAIDHNGAIGCRNELPWKLKSDMAFFRSTTLNHTVIMGRKTFDSIGAPLAKRKNIVLSHNSLLFPSTPDLQLALSVEEALSRASVIRSREVFVVGGAATYQEFAHLVDRYLVTVVDHTAEGADAFLSQQIRDELEAWEIKTISTHRASPDVDQYGFTVFEVAAPDADERADIRQRMIASHMIKKHKSGAAYQRSAPSDFTSFQEAFAF